MAAVRHACLALSAGLPAVHLAESLFLAVVKQIAYLRVKLLHLAPALLAAYVLTEEVSVERLYVLLLLVA